MLHFSSKGDLVNVEKRDAKGVLLSAFSSKFTSNKSYREAAAQLGTDWEHLMRAVDAFRRGGPAVVAEATNTPTDPFAVRLRGRLQRAEEGRECPDLQAAFAADPLPAEPLVEWEDAARLCCVDADLHAGEYRLTEAQVAWIAGRVEPRPRAFWRTHGGGLRLVYEASDPFAADELAAVACLAVARLEPLATLELKTSTRVPPGPRTFQTQTADTQALRAWLGTQEAKDDEVAAYLAERGLEVGARYPHDRCPVAGYDPASRDPVCVHDWGIYCHACASRGVRRGSREPGRFPFGALCGSLLPSPLRAAIRNKVHWEHARFIIAEHLGLTGAVAERCYSAALVLAGHDRRLVERIHNTGHNFVRYNGYWGTTGGQVFPGDNRAILASLPACQFVDGAELRTDPVLVARFAQPPDLSTYGYVPLRPVWGCRIHGVHLAGHAMASVPIVLQCGPLASVGMEARRPRYLAPGKRQLTEEQAWEVLERPFPGLNRAVVKLFIAAKGCQEAGQGGLPPLVFISGPSKGAKTSTVQIAAAICGDALHSVPYTPNSERLRQGLLHAKEQGTFALFNEYLKDAHKRKKSPVEAMDFLLNITEDSTSHKMYVGPVRLGTPPVCVWTDVCLPIELQQDQQLGRRLLHVRMGHIVDWEKTIPAAGLSTPADLRLASQDYADAANVILSGVVDEFFSEPQSFFDIAAQLGFYPLTESAEADEGHAALRELFQAACQAPAPAGSDVRRWPGRGWRVLTREQQTDLAEAWRVVCDEGFTTSRRCDEVDWARLLDLPGPITFEVRSHGQKVAVRWVRRQSRTEYEATEELLPQLQNESFTTLNNITLPEWLNV